MRFFKTIWVLYNISLIFIIVVPGIDITLQTILAVIIIAQNLVSFPITRNLFGIIRILLLILFAVLISGYMGNNLNSVYLNFILWIVNAIAFLKTFNHPHFRDLAIRTWAYTILVFASYRLLTLFGFPQLPFISHQKNGVGVILSVFFPVAFIYFRSKLEKSTFWAVFALFGLVFFLNVSRSSILAFSIISLVLIFSIELQILRKYSYLLILPALVIFFLLALPVLRSSNVYLDEKISDVEKIFAPDYDVKDIEASSFSMRYYLMEKAIDLYNRHPLFGVGLYRFQDYHGTKVDFFLRYERKKWGYNTHNSYLSMLSETGLVGFIPFILLIVYILFTIIRNITRQINQPNLYSLMGAGMAIGILIEMFFVYNIISISVWTYLIIIFPLTNPTFLYHTR